MDGISDKAVERPIVFDWYQDGENCGEPILKVAVFGHTAKTYKAHDNNAWSVIVDGSGIRGFSSKSYAVDEAESTIKKLVKARMSHVKKELNHLFLKPPQDNTAEVARLREALNGLVSDLEMRADKLKQADAQGVVACGNGAYTRAKEALEKSE